MIQSNGIDYVVWPGYCRLGHDATLPVMRRNSDGSLEATAIVRHYVCQTSDEPHSFMQCGNDVFSFNGDLAEWDAWIVSHDTPGNVAT